MNQYLTLVLLVALSIPNGLKCFGTELMGEETIGNKPLNEANYKNWPGLMPVANHGSRVYHTWVNGDERFYYQADVNKLNELLVSFDKMQNKPAEIVLLPGPGNVKNFKGDQQFTFNCEMHLVGGIAQHIAGKDKGKIYWPMQPRITIRVDGEELLEKLRIPKGCQLIPVAELKQRYIEGLESKDLNVRGWGLGFLARVDPYDQQTMREVAKRLGDDHDWVVLNALSCIDVYGYKAEPFLSEFTRIAQGQNEQNAAAAKKAMAKVKDAMRPERREEFEKLESAFRSNLRLIESFANARSGL